MDDLTRKQKSTIKVFRNYFNKISNPDVNGIILDFIGDGITYYCEDCKNISHIKDDCFTDYTTFYYCPHCNEGCDDCKKIKHTNEIQTVYCGFKSNKNVCIDCILDGEKK